MVRGSAAPVEIRALREGGILHSKGSPRHWQQRPGVRMVWRGCLLALAAAGGRPAAAQDPPPVPQSMQPAAQGAAETPIAPGAFPGGGSPLLTCGEDPNRQLAINGFGVLGYDYDANTGKNS